MGDVISFIPDWEPTWAPEHDKVLLEAMHQGVHNLRTNASGYTCNAVYYALRAKFDDIDDAIRYGDMFEESVQATLGERTTYCSWIERKLQRHMDFEWLRARRIEWLQRMIAKVEERQ